MSAAFLVNYLALGPLRARIGKGVAAKLPVMVDLGLAENELPILEELKIGGRQTGDGQSMGAVMLSVQVRQPRKRQTRVAGARRGYERRRIFPRRLRCLISLHQGPGPDQRSIWTASLAFLSGFHRAQRSVSTNLDSSDLPSTIGAAV